MRKYFGLFTAMLLVFTLVLAGCGSKGEQLEPKAALEKAVNAAMELESYGFKGKMKLNIELPPEILEADPDAGMAFQMLQSTELVVSGVYQKEPMQSEITVDLNMGDMKFSIPMVMKEKTLYVKVPDIPMISMFLPPDLIGKYIEIDLEELAELSGGELQTDSIDWETQQKLTIDMFDALLSSFDEKTYFKNYAADDVELPSGVEAEQVVKFQVNNDNFDDAVETFITKALPAVIDVLSKQEYLDALGLEKSDLDQVKEDIELTDEEIADGISEMKETVKINDLSITTAMDEDYHLPYIEFNIDTDVTDAGQTGNITFNYSMEMTNINKEQTFEIGVPSGDDVIDIMELEQMFYEMEY
ncbi:lipoprotein [Marinicrinis lubricantis]|uniref:Lipoprotein n=1 Tax=Marinicrinis lubricantis TaxID=2086470 RepID=A0ABW1IK88_9BACL